MSSSLSAPNLHVNIRVTFPLLLYIFQALEGTPRSRERILTNTLILLLPRETDNLRRSSAQALGV